MVAEVERRLLVIEELEGSFNGNFDRAGRLRQFVLTSAFPSGLVSQ